jgi:exosortase/archaeosortase family protein
MLAIRYLFLLSLAFAFFYTSLVSNILLLLTLYPAGFVIGLFADVAIRGSVLFIGPLAIELVPACLAVSAYFLLIALNLLTPMPSKKRTFSLIFSVLAILIINILRVVCMTAIRLNNPELFQAVHFIIWYVLSTVFVIAVWFLTVYLFRIKDIPFYTDFKRLRKN